MPKIVSIDFRHPEKAQPALKTIRGVLEAGGVIAFPTDTFYGLGADPGNERAVKKIFRIKRRPAHKPLLILVASRKQAAAVVEEIPPDAETLMQALWPGPLTLLLRARPVLPQSLTAGSGKIGVRLPASPFARQLIEHLGHPLTAPSANISGAENIRTATEVRQALGSTLDLIVDGGPTPGGKASTILDTTLSPPELLREGQITREHIETILGKSVAQPVPIH
ncbi:MAG: L-threonylcarbamoyladenylate synthase [Nitrospinales bacterium]